MRKIIIFGIELAIFISMLIFAFQVNTYKQKIKDKDKEIIQLNIYLKSYQDQVMAEKEGTKAWINNYKIAFNTIWKAQKEGCKVPSIVDYMDNTEEDSPLQIEE